MADTAVLRIRVESNGINAAKTDLNALAAQSTRTENVVSRLKGVIGTVAAAIGANEVIRYADAWTTVSNKLTNVTKSGETLADVQNRVFAISQQTNSSLEATATLYGRLEPATRGLVSSGVELGDIIETINKSMLVSGATASESAGALVQLAQGLGAGALRGEEFNSVNEAAPRLMQAIADSLGVTRGALKGYAAEGKLTSEVVINAMRSQADAIDTEFSRMDKTFEQKGVQAWNNVVKAIGTDGSLKSAVSQAGDLMVGLSEHVDTLITIGEAMALVYGSRLVGSIATSNAAMTALTAVTNLYTVATTPAIVKTDALGMAISTTSRAAQVGAAGLSVWNTVVSALGGYVGLITLAATATYLIVNSQEQAKQAAIDYANGLDTSTAALEKMTIAQRQSTEVKLTDAITAQQIEVNKTKQEVADLTEKWDQYQKESKAVGLTVDQNAEAHNNLITKTAELETKEGILSEMTSKLYAIQSTFARKLDETSFGMKGYGEKLSTVAQIEKAFSEAVGFGNEKLKTRQEYVTNLSGKSIFGAQALAEINALNANADALAIQDKRLREATQARNSYTQSGKFTEAEINELVNAHMREYDQQQKNEASERAASKALQASESAASKAASAAKQHAEEVERQKQAIADLTVELKANQLEAAGEGRAAAELTAKHEAQQQGLGNLTQSYVSAKLALYDFQQQQNIDTKFAEYLDGETAALLKLRETAKAQLDGIKQDIVVSGINKQLGEQTFSGLPSVSGVGAQTNESNQMIQLQQETQKMNQAYQQRIQMYQQYAQNDLQNKTYYYEQVKALQDKQVLENQMAQTAMMNLSFSVGEAQAAAAAESFGTIMGEQSAAYRIMFGIQKGFSIAQSMMAIQTGIANAASLTFPANLAAMASVAAATGNIISSIQAVGLSFEGGGFTGYGSRSGGLDGKGGFYAILHPNETVIDHTKGQSSSGSNTTNNRSTVVNVNQVINTTGKIDTRTSKQIASDTARKQRMVTSRLG